MPYNVFLTANAIRDLEELYQYIATHDAVGKADNVLTKIEKTCQSLSESPKRGVYPKELLALGIREYREVFFKAYRLIYRMIDEKIYILLIADGRRDMQSLLERRLFENQQ
jgi:toxin ParE1/3/4